MNAVNAIGGGTQQTAAAPQQQGLGKDDFLKMLLAQLKNQDPLNPQSDPQFMGTMAQFTSLEQMTNLVKGFEQSAWAGQVSQSVSLIGKTVTWVESEGSAPQSGVVTSVTFDDGDIQVNVGDVTIQPGSIQTIQ